MEDLEHLRLLKVERVAELLDLSSKTIYRAVADGRLPSVRIGGAVRVPLAAVEDLVSARIA